MTTFATNDDILKYFPTAFEHGVADWTDELALAQTDVELKIKSKWYVSAFTSSRAAYSSSERFDPELLTASQWTKSTVYRALSDYILPKLSTFRPEGDPFQVQIDFFSKKFAEELDMQITSGVEYDINDDGSIGDNEKYASSTNRLYR